MSLTHFCSTQSKGDQHLHRSDVDSLRAALELQGVCRFWTIVNVVDMQLRPKFLDTIVSAIQRK
jgi:hypothetical protein